MKKFIIAGVIAVTAVTQSGAGREDNPDQYIANMTDSAWQDINISTFWEMNLKLS